MEFNEEFLRKAEDEASAPHYIEALLTVEPIKDELMRNPKAALGKVIGIYDKALNNAYTDKTGENKRTYISAVAGGPCEIIPQTLYNCFGAVYPYLEDADKETALRKILGILDRLNYIYVQDSHTPGIREPLLLTDVCLARGLYWPGLDKEENALKKISDFYQIRSDMMDIDGNFNRHAVESDFLMACALLYGKKFDKQYADSANPSFFSRVKKALSARYFANCEKPEHFEQQKEAIKEDFSEFLHNDLLDYKGHWMNYKKFR